MRVRKVKKKREKKKMCGYHVLKKEKKKSLKINHNHELGVNTREITWAEKQP